MKKQPHTLRNFGIIAALIIVGLYALGGGGGTTATTATPAPAPAVTVTAPAAPTTTAPEATDETTELAFLAFVDDSIPAMESFSDDQKRALGQEVCRQWIADRSAAGIMASATGLVSFADISFTEAGMFMGGAVVAYCPTEWDEYQLTLEGV